MTTKLAIYESFTKEDVSFYSQPGNLDVTAFFDEGAAVQFTIGHYYCTLSQKQVEHLIKTLQKRLDFNYKDEDTDNIVKKDGREYKFEFD